MLGQDVLDPDTRAFYCRTIERLNDAGVPYLVGGAYALGHYTGIERHTKDFDVFVHRRDLERALDVLGETGCRTELTFPHWLGKAHCEGDFVDVIFSSGNAIAEVDDEWFEYAIDGDVLGLPVRLCPVEEIIWSKAFIMERERYDGADIAHLLFARADHLDWERLVRRFGPNWRVLLSHLTLFGFIYPSERARIPRRVMEELLGRLVREMNAPSPPEPVCRGPLISRAQYRIDVECWGFLDARRAPHGRMSDAEIARWTDAIDE